VTAGFESWRRGADGGSPAAADREASVADSGSSAGGRTLAPFGRRRLPVIGRREYGDYVVLSVADPGGPAPDPGQFAMLAAAERWGGGTDERPFLPRAFSVARRHDDGTLDFVLEAVGPGTERLAELDAGDEAWLLGPLGRGFRPPRDGRRPILVGGGIGIAPLAILQDVLGASALVLLGFRDAAHAEGAALLREPRVATDDGSVGHHGFVTELLAAEIAGADVYACGPPPMLEAVRALCAEHDVPAQLALESGMACGFGACFGCVVPTRNGYVRLCVDGPVLEAADLDRVEDSTAPAGAAA
jgi:dihydroorotate dehydrogenase electron transfer subunit